MQLLDIKQQNVSDTVIPFKAKTPNVEGYSSTTQGSFKTFF